MISLKRSITGIAITAVSALSLSGVALGASEHSDSRGDKSAKISMSQQVRVCLDARRSGGYFTRTITRAQRTALRAEFRTCIREAITLRNGQSHSKSSKSAHNSKSSKSSVSHSSKSSTVRAQIVIDDFAYSPQTLTVTKGTKVRWENEDDAPHTVTGTLPGGPNSGELDEDEDYSFTFTSTGTYTYHCAFHPTMTGSVIVTN